VSKKPEPPVWLADAPDDNGHPDPVNVYKQGFQMKENPLKNYNHCDEIIDDGLLDEYRNLNDENSSIGRLKLPDDENVLNVEEI
jgi:hypothetical protein